MPWEVFAVVFPHKRELVTAPITFTYDREGRRASVDIPGWVRLEVEPIKNPVTGEEHKARIVLPEGMEFKEAEMGNTVSMSATAEAP